MIVDSQKEESNIINSKWYERTFNDKLIVKNTLVLCSKQLLNVQLYGLMSIRVSHNDTSFY